MEIIYSVLKAIAEKGRGARRTSILYRSNLSHPLLCKYLDFVTECSLVRTEKSNERLVYHIEGKGREFIRTFEQMRSILED
jgi:predicted transcriptional regulator